MRCGSASHPNVLADGTARTRVSDPRDGSTGDPHDDVVFLARSPNRVAVLAALGERPATRADLLDLLDLSRVTLGRVLDDLEDRGWVVRDGVRYASTPTGDLVADAYADLSDALAFAREYGDVVRWLPTDEMDFDLRLLADAEVTRADRTDPLAVMRRVAEQTSGASRIRALSHAIDPGFVSGLHDGVTAGRLDAEFVVTADVVETFAADEEYATQIRALIEAGAPAYRYDGDVPHLLSTFDDAVGIGVTDGDGTPVAVLHSEHPAVASWAAETYERYRADATRLTADEFEA